MNIATPPNAADVKQTVEQRLAALDEKKGLPETVQIEWRNTTEALPVITMPIALLRYNPESHRIRAQRSLDPDGDKHLSDDPYGDQAQEYLHRLLKGQPSDPTQPDPGFITLQDDLKQYGQKAPGIITRDGILINGNTRRAALHELGAEDIRVGVLPPDASMADLETIELSLQLRREHRRDYSFMNFLLAIDERRTKGWSKDKILSEFRIKPVTFDRSVWILEAVREVIARSKRTLPDGDTVSLRLVDFETHQGKLEELYRTYVKLKQKSKDEADAMREQRLMAIALDHSKTDVRLITPDFAPEYMADLIPAVKADGSATVIPGTTVAIEQPDQNVKALGELTNEVLQLRAMEKVSDALPPEAVKQHTERLDEIRTKLRNAVIKADVRAKEKQRRAAAVDRLSDANDDLEHTITAVVQARAAKTFEPDDLDEALQILKKNLTKLAQEASRGVDQPSEGLLWLRAVVSSSN